jgi:hypothetical protein
MLISKVEGLFLHWNDVLPTVIWHFCAVGELPGKLQVPFQPILVMKASVEVNV